MWCHGVVNRRNTLLRLQRPDHLGIVPAAEALAEVHAIHRLLVDEIEPHEEAEDVELYPVVAHALGGTDPTGTMSRAHAEIHHAITRLGRLLDDIGPDGPDQDDIIELRRLLYGLHAILRLHTAQEEEGYLSLADDTTGESQKRRVCRDGCSPELGVIVTSVPANRRTGHLATTFVCEHLSPS